MPMTLEEKRDCEVRPLQQASQGTVLKPFFSSLAVAQHSSFSHVISSPTKRPSESARAEDPGSDSSTYIYKDPPLGQEESTSAFQAEEVFCPAFFFLSSPFFPSLAKRTPRNSQEGY